MADERNRLSPILTTDEMSSLQQQQQQLTHDGSVQNVKVMVRVRLFNEREMKISARKHELLAPCVRMRGNTCAVIERFTDDKGFPAEREREAFDFDECFWSLPAQQHAFSTSPFATQEMVYERSGLLALQNALQGYNVCIFAYGQTGSGKTYTMLGAPTDPGISPRLVDDLFVSARNPLVKFTIECMFFEIYNEKVRDLFTKKKAKPSDEDVVPKIRQHPTRGVYVEGLTSKEVSTADMTKRLIERGTQERAVAETDMNLRSSRSHAVFQIRVTQADPMQGTQKVSLINLVDLAGSEKLKQSNALGKVADEAKAINLSLTTLRKVFDALIENSKLRFKKNHRLPPFRESVLTHCLADSLGGNSRTMMLATISPHEENLEDILGTLRYALKAKSIVCDARVNEERSAVMIDHMRQEIMQLQEKLRAGVVPAGGVMSLEIQQEIEEREKEVQRMEERQKRLQEEMQEMVAKEHQLHEKVKEAEVERAAMQVVVDSQKKDRFAAAFRNAFLINSEKKKHQETSLLSVSLKARVAELERHNRFLETELHAKSELFEELRASTEVRIDELTRELQLRDGLLSQMRKQSNAVSDENRFLKDQNTSIIQRVQTLDAAKGNLEKCVQRQVQELLSERAISNRIQEEKANVEHTLEASKKAWEEELSNMRRRKDKYKMMFMETNASNEASRTVINALHGDRSSLLSTIKAQQQVLEELSEAVKRMANERRDSDDKSRRLEKVVSRTDVDAKLMGEALREYQAAATEFVYENHTLQMELERLLQANKDTLALAEQQRCVHKDPQGGMSPGSLLPRQSVSPFRPLTPTKTSYRKIHQGSMSPIRTTMTASSPNGGSPGVVRQ